MPYRKIESLADLGDNCCCLLHTCLTIGLLQAPPQPPKGPTPSFAAIMGATSKFDEAAWENIAANKHKGKKKSTDNTSATKAAEAVKNASPPMPQPLSPVLQEDFSPVTRPLDLTLTLLT